MEMNRPKAPASETLQTADLDNRGILQLQDQSMRQQDAELEELERTVTSTKVLALAFLQTAISAIFRLSLLHAHPAKRQGASHKCCHDCCALCVLCDAD